MSTRRVAGSQWLHAPAGVLLAWEHHVHHTGGRPAGRSRDDAFLAFLQCLKTMMMTPTIPEHRISFRHFHDTLARHGRRYRDTAPPDLISDLDRPGTPNRSQQRLWDSFDIGSFANTDKVPVKSRGRNDMRYRPHPTHPFADRRVDGTIIRPGELRTDGSSIPVIGTALSGITRWIYGLPALLHDWEFDQHHRGALPAGRTLEAVKALMVTGLVPINLRHFRLVHRAVETFGEDYWDR